jgi:ubiquinone/menaquinone biosynthesis C-methylase UbiE
MTRNWYERHVLPRLVDLACSNRRFREQRQKVVPLARGRVLEIGIGTGLNLQHYDRARIDRIVGLDPGLEMHALARRRSRHLGLEVELVGLSAEGIPFEAHSFDTVIVTYTLCTIADPLAALREMRRVLRPEGRLLFCEHGLAPDDFNRRWQHRLTPLWSKVAGGCHLDRDIPALLQAGGFRPLDLQQMYPPGPRLLNYNYVGTAVAG